MPSIELEITSPITRLLEDAEACHALDDVRYDARYFDIG